MPAEVERVLRKALSRTPEDRYYSALEFARDMQRVQQALYGRAVQTTVEGVPDYPQNMYAQTSAFDQSAPVAKQHARWAKPLAVTVAAAAAVVVMALAFVTVVMPNMDASSDNSKVQVQNHGAQNHAEDDPDSAITSGSVPSVQDLTGEYTADGKVRFTWVNPSPKDGDSYAWSLVGDSGTRPERAGHHHGVDEYRNRSGRRRADVRAGESGSRGPADVRESHDRVRGQAVSLRPDAGDMNRYEPIQPGMHAGKQVGACGWMRGQAKFGHNQGRASR